jgi:hypothetical protein
MGWVRKRKEIPQAGPDVPDLAQGDFWLFKNMKTELEGNAFINAMGTIPKISNMFERVTQSSSKSRADK